MKSTYHPSVIRIRLTIFKDAYMRILKNPDFAFGCEKQKIGVSPQTLEVENGEAIKNDEGKWFVSNKVKIKFI